MRRSGSAAQRIRAPSPTNTTYSGFSNYKSEAYRPIVQSSMTASSGDSRAVAQTHFDELHRYLASYLAKGSLL